MSVWSVNSTPALAGSEGELVSVIITVEPKLLEKLLDVLAHLDFPINPQLYHDAATIYLSADSTERVQPVAIVEFPAWAGRLPRLRDALLASSFPPECLVVKGMLDDIRYHADREPAPPGAPYKSIVRSKHGLRATA